MWLSRGKRRRRRILHQSGVLSGLKRGNPGGGDESERGDRCADLQCSVDEPAPDRSQQHATGETTQKSHKMCTDIRIGVAGTRIHEKRKTTDDRTDPVRPALLGHQLAAPDKAGQNSECREDRGRCTDRTMGRLQQQGIQHIAARTGQHDGQPADARAEQTAGEETEKRTEYDVPGDVAQTGMQREGGYRSPPLARANEDPSPANQATALITSM